MSLLFNMLPTFVIAFLPRSKYLLISWLQSPSAVILELKKIMSVTVSIVSPSICQKVMILDAMILVFLNVEFFIFNWRIIALQNFVVFCQTSTWIIYIYIYPFPFWTSVPSPTPFHPSRLIQSPCFEFPEPYRKFLLNIYFTYDNVSFMLLFPYISPSAPRPQVHKSIFYVCFSTATL